MALAPTLAPMLPDQRLFSSSPWKLGMSPTFLPSSMIWVLVYPSKNPFSQKTSIKTGDISPFSIAALTAGIWLSITSFVCSASVLPLGMAWAPQKVLTIVSLFLYFSFSTSIAFNILTSLSALSPYPDFISTVVVPSLLILPRYLSSWAASSSTVACATELVVNLIPSPALQISAQPIPFSFISYSGDLSPQNTACVWASTYPGSTQYLEQSITWSNWAAPNYLSISAAGPTFKMRPSAPTTTEQPSLMATSEHYCMRLQGCLVSLTCTSCLIFWSQSLWFCCIIIGHIQPAIEKHPRGSSAHAYGQRMLIQRYFENHLSCLQVLLAQLSASLTCLHSSQTPISSLGTARYKSSQSSLQQFSSPRLQMKVLTTLRAISQ